MSVAVVGEWIKLRAYVCTVERQCYTKVPYLVFVCCRMNEYGDSQTIEKPGMHLKLRQAKMRRTTPRCGLKNFFSFCKARHVLSILCIRRGIPRACLTLIYRHAMARIAAASEACGSARCAIYSNRGEAAVSCLSLPLPEVYSQLKRYMVKRACQSQWWESG